MIVTVPCLRDGRATLSSRLTVKSLGGGSAVVLFDDRDREHDEVGPALNVSVAVFAWKSLPASAVPATVVTVTVTRSGAARRERDGTETVCRLLVGLRDRDVGDRTAIRNIVVGDRAGGGRRRPDRVAGAGARASSSRLGALDGRVVDRGHRHVAVVEPAANVSVSRLAETYAAGRRATV